MEVLTPLEAEILESRRTRARQITAVVVLLFFLIVARLHGHTLASTQRPFGFQGAIAEALWHGNLDMGPAPAGLLQLADPYDPVQNARFRNQGLHDFSLYDGKIYAPFGPTPAVILHLPFKALGLGYLNSRLATLIFIASGFLACVGVLRRSIDRWAPQCPWWVESMAIVGMGIGTSLPFQIWIGGWYEVPIACGFMCVAVALWALSRTFEPGSRQLGWFFLASVSVGLAVGSRPYLAVASLALLAVAFIALRSHWERGIPWSRLAALFLPLISIVLMLMLYNRARFGSPFEFGSRYQLAGVNMNIYPIGKPSYLVANLRDYVLAGPAVRGNFPYLHLIEPDISPDVRQHSHEWIAGFGTSFPWIFIGLLVAASSVSLWARTRRGLVVVLGIIAAIALISITAVGVTFNASTMRYLVDFVPWFALLAAIALSVAFGTDRFSARARPTMLGIWVVSLVWSCLCGIAFSVVNCKAINYC